MSEHTPGPWIACSCGCGFVGGGDDMVCQVTSGPWGDEGVNIITGERSLVHHWGTVPEERARANARLIAAAPDYHEALIDIRNRILCPVGAAPSLDMISEIASKALKARTMS